MKLFSPFTGIVTAVRLGAIMTITLSANFAAVNGLAAVPTQPVSISVTDDRSSSALPPRFLGLSYEISMLLPKAGRYYFDSKDQDLVNLFRTLGIRSLRVGANAVDDPRIPIPQEKDIDKLFDFARAAGVKVIYSFRLQNGNPADSARLAGYIMAHYADALECFSIGNEPDLYTPPIPTFEAFFAQWKPHYDAILKVAPNAMFDGPSVARSNCYALHLAKATSAEGHLAMASDHYYFLGSGRLAETNPPVTRSRFLTNRIHERYEKSYAKIGAVLAAQEVPYRIDEVNSCSRGGAKDASDTYASTLWALDCLHWWADHHILGMNFHTGESVGRDGGFGAANYALFVHRPDGRGLTMRPEAYAFLAFNQGARGRPLKVTVQSAPGFDFNAYAYREESGSIYLTLINKNHGTQAQTATVAVHSGQDAKSGTWQRVDLAQKNQDVAAKNDVQFGGAAITPEGIWSGEWEKIEMVDADNLTVQLAPASATILRYSPAKTAVAGLNQ